jgi:ammonia channel protein AmtB
MKMSECGFWSRTMNAAARGLPTVVAVLAAVGLALLWHRLQPAAPPDDRPELPPFFRLVATVLVFFMQVGFIAFEAGAVPKAYRLESAVKNLLVCGVALMAYAFLGAPIQHWLNRSAPTGPGALMQLSFDALFASTASLIVANAVTERATITANICCAFVGAGLAYPVLAALLWNHGAVVQRFDFVDTGGACVVHLLGGSFGLFAAERIGPRFRAQAWHLLGRPARADERTLMPLAVLGGVFLWFGWLGFNTGTAPSTAAFERAFTNTLFAGGAGAVAVVALAGIARVRVRERRIRNLLKRSGGGPTTTKSWLCELADLEKVVIGMMGGLVAVTANATLIEAHQACLEAAIGGLVAVAGSVAMNHLSRSIDDPLGTIATHGGAAMVGLLFTPLWHEPARFSVQLMGCCLAILLGGLCALVACAPLRGLEALVLENHRRSILLGFLLPRLRQRLNTYHQATGKHGSESWVALVEMVAARQRIMGARLDHAWREALELWAWARGEEPPATQAQADVHRALVTVLQQRPFTDGRPFQTALAALGALSQFSELRQCVERARAHREAVSGIGDKPWRELSTRYRETLVWTVGVLAEGQGLAMLARQSTAEGLVDSCRFADEYNGFESARALLVTVKEDDDEDPQVRELARIALVDLRASPLHRLLRLMFSQSVHKNRVGGRGDFEPPRAA